MYRVISEVRAEQLMKQAQDYIYNPSFDEQGKEAAYPGADARAWRSSRSSGPTCGCPRTCRRSSPRSTRSRC